MRFELLLPAPPAPPLLLLLLLLPAPFVPLLLLLPPLRLSLLGDGVRGGKLEVPFAPESVPMLLRRSHDSPRIAVTRAAV